MILVKKSRLKTLAMPIIIRKIRNQHRQMKNKPSADQLVTTIGGVHGSAQPKRR